MRDGSPAIRGSMRVRNVTRTAWAGFALLFYPIGLLTPRNPRLWVFGNRTGFSDNSRYLMEHVAAHHPDVRTVWLAHSGAALKQARSQGLEAHAVASPTGVYLAFRAGVGVVCQGVSDLNRAALGGMKVVNLYHGTAFKRIGLDSPVTWSVVPGSPERTLNRVVRRLFRIWMRMIDLLVAPSAVAADHLESAFGLPRDRIAVTGTPRTDVILESHDAGCPAGREYRRIAGLPPESRLVLYAPTWREYGEAGPLLEGFSPTDWDHCLEARNAYLLIRMHPHMHVKDSDRARLQGGRVVWPSPGDWGDVNRLLCAVDLLVTDYSSIVFDYSVLGRPIVFYAPDYAEFVAARSFYEPYDRLTGGSHCTTWDEARERVAAGLDDEDGAPAALARAISERYNPFRDTENRRRIVNEIRAN